MRFESVPRLRVVFLIPAAAVLVVLFVLPLIIVGAYSGLARGLYGGTALPVTIEAYGRLFDPLYLLILWRSVLIAAVSTAVCLLLAFPLALFIARASSRRTLYLNLVMLPFWTSFLIRTYAWMFLLRDTGLVNTALQAVHLITQPLPLLFNAGAVIVGLVYAFLPFMVLPLYATLEKLDPALLDAAADLGASPAVVLRTVVIPMAKPGIWAGCVLVFVPCLGAFLTPDLMGGGKTVMIGNLIQNQFTTARDWPFGSALSLLLMALAFLTMKVLSRRAEALL